jgi:hypothetical protein
MAMIRRWIPKDIRAVIFRLESPNIIRSLEKKPSLRMKDWVFSCLTFTVLHRRPIVKRIQAGFLAYGSSYLA